MADIEKVIKYADMCLSSACSEKSYECPYQTNHEGLYSCAEGVLRDAVALLKEQQPRKPHYTILQYIVEGKEVSVKHPECPKCVENGLSLWDAEIERGQAFCKRCGQAIDWSKEATNREKNEP